MFFYSGKYKGGMVCGRPPKMLVFANEKPKTEGMALDRWMIRELPHGQGVGELNEERWDD